MALLSGRRETAEIARFTQSLTQEQRKKVGLPLEEGTDRCEQSAANALVESMPVLDNQLITADALDCQRKVAHCGERRRVPPADQGKPTQSGEAGQDCGGAWD